MENTLFQGSLISWAVGIIFIILILLTNDDPRIQTLSLISLKYTDGMELLNQLKFLTKIAVAYSKHIKR